MHVASPHRPVAVKRKMVLLGQGVLDHGEFEELDKYWDGLTQHELATELFRDLRRQYDLTYSGIILSQHQNAAGAGIINPHGISAMSHSQLEDFTHKCCILYEAHLPPAQRDLVFSEIWKEWFECVGPLSHQELQNGRFFSLFASCPSIVLTEPQLMLDYHRDILHKVENDLELSRLGKLHEAMPNGPDTTRYSRDVVHIDPMCKQFFLALDGAKDSKGRYTVLVVLIDPALTKAESPNYPLCDYLKGPPIDYSGRRAWRIRLRVAVHMVARWYKGRDLPRLPIWESQLSIKDEAAWLANKIRLLDTSDASMKTAGVSLVKLCVFRCIPSLRIPKIPGALRELRTSDWRDCELDPAMIPGGANSLVLVPDDVRTSVRVKIQAVVEGLELMRANPGLARLPGVPGGHPQADAFVLFRFYWNGQRPEW